MLRERKLSFLFGSQPKAWKCEIKRALEASFAQPTDGDSGLGFPRRGGEAVDSEFVADWHWVAEVITKFFAKMEHNEKSKWVLTVIFKRIRSWV